VIGFDEHRRKGDFGLAATSNDIAFVTLRQHPIHEVFQPDTKRVTTLDVREDERTFGRYQRLPDAPHCQRDPAIRQVVENPACNHQVEWANGTSFLRTRGIVALR